MGLAAVAATIAINIRSSKHFDVPLAILEFGQVHYDIRGVHDSTGLGGFPAVCAPPGQDYVQVTYSVSNRSQVDVSGAAVPHVVLIDQLGQVVRRDTTLTNLVSAKANPPLLIPHGVLHSGESVVLADVFVTARNATRFYAFKMRPEPGSAQAYQLPLTQRADTPECVRQAAPVFIPEG
jgi:hypothetical protein